MIELTRLGSHATRVAINAELIVTVDEVPDTLVRLSNGDKILVREPLEEVINRVIAYRGRILAERDRALGGQRSEGAS